jgi:hypothetical protein
MMEGAEVWEANGWRKVGHRGRDVRNLPQVEELAARLKPLHVEFRKVAGHKGDEWNDAVDRLAVKGRDEAGGLPRCSFEIKLETGSIPFVEKPIPGSVTIQELWGTLQRESVIILPEVTEFNVFKGLRKHEGAWETGHYEFKLKNTPKVERTKALLAHMIAGREAGKGQGMAVSQMVEPVFSVCLDQGSTNVMMKVPSRITMEQLAQEISGELAMGPKSRGGGLMEI